MPRRYQKVQKLLSEIKQSCGVLLHSREESKAEDHVPTKTAYWRRRAQSLLYRDSGRKFYT